MSYDLLVDECDRVFGFLDVSVEQAENLEQATKNHDYGFAIELEELQHLDLRLLLALIQTILPHHLLRQFATQSQ